MAVLSPGSAESNRANDPLPMVMVPFCFWLPRPVGVSPPGDSVTPSALYSAIGAHLSSLGWPEAEPLRWAITAVDPIQGLQLEGVAIRDQQAPQGRR